MLVCKHCGSESIVRRGYSSSGKVKIQCKECDLYSLGDDEAEPNRPVRSARILLLDIETLPGEYYAFDPKVDYLSPDKMIKDWSISCFAAKWLFEPEIFGKAVTPQEAFDRNETSILGDVWQLMSEADIIITQNGINFDIKKLNTKFLTHRYAPPSKYSNVDTLKVAQSVFGFSYNRLNELGQKLGIGKKTDMDFQGWKNCLTNDDDAKKALEHKLEYCKRDVAPLLEDVYLYFLPWIPNHPNLNLFTNHDGDVCPKCESEDLNWGEEYNTPQNLWNGFRCNSCGAIGRGKGKSNKIKSANVTN